MYPLIGFLSGHGTVILAYLQVLLFGEKNISSKPTQLQHMKVDMEDGLDPNHNPRNRPNIEGEEPEHDSISRSSRIT